MDRPGETRTIRRRILQHNEDLAAELRDDFERAGVFVVSSPGSGKTESLQRTMAALHPGVRVAAVTGGLAPESDADRLGLSGAPVRQILTGTMCSLIGDSTTSICCSSRTSPTWSVRADSTSVKICG